MVSMNKVKFGDVVRLSKARSSDPIADGYERYIGLDHIEPGDLRIRRWGNVADGVTFTSVFKPGQVLFGKRRAYQRKVAVANFAGVCSGDIYVFESKDSKILLPELLPFICQTEAFFQHAVGTSAGSLSPRTNWTSLADFVFALPPMEEQNKTSAILSLMDDVVESYRVSTECAMLVFESVANDLFGVSTKRWNIKRIEEISHFVTNGFVGKSAEHYVVNDGVPYLVSKNVRRNKFKLDDLTFISHEFHKKAKKSQLQAGDILTVQSGHIGETAVVSYDLDGANCHALIITRPKTELIDPHFVSYFLNSTVGQRILSRLVIGSTIQHLNTSDLKKLDIPVPPIKEQKEIVSLLKTMSHDHDALRQRLNNAINLRLRLMEEVFK